ncbi:MAG: aminotransferase class I/II-fold pyridoxal phosphate-dependent enzyme [Firmicutes bacterium]|nr:aminotransferase class I/II-fold pyridoxal phosphate-dependent enzyme [Bacillota bacterium]
MRNHLNTALYTSKRSAIRQFSTLAKETPGCVALTLGEPDFDTPLPVREAADYALNNHETHYIANDGSMELREAIAAFEKNENGVSYEPTEVIVTAGATEALFTALMGIINPGDEVIVPTPAFSLYEEIINLCRGVFVPLDTSEDGFQLNADKLNSLVTDKTKAIILNSPNNPTGCIYNEESLGAVRQAVMDKPIFVICDDVYRQIRYTEEYKSFSEYTDLKEKIILIQSFSKPYAMTGWRMGYLMADASIIERIELLHQYMIVSTPAPFQRACISAIGFKPTELTETYKKRRAFMLRRIEEIGMDVIEPDGAFYLFPSIEKYGITSSEFCTRMIKEEGLAATPGFCFGSDKHIRLTYCYSDDELTEGMNRLEKFVKKLEGK